MVIKQILCDKCGRKIADDKQHPRLVIQKYKHENLVTSPKGWRNDRTINLCEEHFTEFTAFLGGSDDES